MVNLPGSAAFDPIKVHAFDHSVFVWPCSKKPKHMYDVTGFEGGGGENNV